MNHPTQKQKTKKAQNKCIEIQNKKLQNYLNNSTNLVLFKYLTKYEPPDQKNKKKDPKQMYRDTKQRAPKLFK